MSSSGRPRSTCSFISEVLWKRLRNPHDKYISINGGWTDFKIIKQYHTNSYSQDQQKMWAKRNITYQWLLRNEGSRSPFSLYLGLDFLTMHKVLVDFWQCALTHHNSDKSVPLDNGPSFYYYFSPDRCSPAQGQQRNKDVGETADVTLAQRSELLDILHRWPAVCTNKLGKRRVITHHSVDEIPVRKRVYPISIHEQQLV